MKTTVEIPDALVREVKLRAVHEGRKLKDVIADLLRKGLDAPMSESLKEGSRHLDRDERSRLPIVRCKGPDNGQQKLSPDLVAEILLKQEVQWQRDAGVSR